MAEMCEDRTCRRIVNGSEVPRGNNHCAGRHGGRGLLVMPAIGPRVSRADLGKPDISIKDLLRPPRVPLSCRH